MSFIFSLLLFLRDITPEYQKKREEVTKISDVIIKGKMLHFTFTSNLLRLAIRGKT